ncbi:hypothetical protein C8N43_1823 [Litoreibacter ponti]|uniref:Uncharacterized protein n=1 Tax=Litoreibacter ponti TaxID=1510457 RepID=A0A2T6BME0_9RHOB|nr:hypothetical protein [Litoreibacter ponti]PTX57157.1 hypothetical protein C8N43_1823 [Litoreibacter ponti]
MMRYLPVLALAACGAAVPLDEPTQSSEQAIARFVADVAFDKSPAEQAAIANCGAQNTTTEELQFLAGVEVLDASTTGMISEIMTREGTLLCMESNGVSL